MLSKLVNSLNEIRKSFRQIVFFYFLSQIIPVFLIGIAVFLSIIMMMQFLQISEFLLIHKVSVFNVVKILSYMSVSFLPIIFPMSLLFSILLTYARMSSDSELTAFKALGYSPLKLSIPAVFFSIIISFISSQALFVVGPVARGQLDLLVTNIGNQKIISGIKAGTFSESFFNLVLYANKVDEDRNLMEDVFIYDSRNADRPVVIVAKSGTVRSSTDLVNQSAEIVLSNGSMFSRASASAAKLKFETYTLTISSPIEAITQSQDTNTFRYNDLQYELKVKKLPEPRLKELAIELYGRYATILTCMIFGFLGSALGSGIDRRSGTSQGFVLSIICIICYWLLYLVMKSVAVKSSLPPMLLVMVPDILGAGVTLWAWRRI